jgi:hypothetical protein
MGAKTPKKVDFERLADALTGYHSAYLVTVDDDYRVHTVDVEPELHEQVIEVGPVGGRTRRNVENRSAVTLLWPPSEAGGYSLIVDGLSQLTGATDPGEDTAALRVAPTRALLHRKAGSGIAAGARHDCVVFSQP